MPLKIALLLGIVTVQLASGEREHKVHGIVLYPDRHSWCQTTPIKQVVASPGYESATIDNNVCVGACYSYSIPRTQPAEPGELIGPYCDSCQPSETKCFHVTLHASEKNIEGPPTIQKRVQIITNCSCMSCENKQNNDCEVVDRRTSELPPDLFTILHANKTDDTPSIGADHSNQPLLDETPELLNFSPNGSRPEINAEKTNITNEQRYKTMINLFKSIQNAGEDTNFDYDKNQLKELLDIIEGSKHELSDKNLMEFVNFINVHNSENLQLDLSRLKEVLMAFRKNQDLVDKHRNFGIGLGTKNNNDDINKDVNDLTKKYGLPKNFGLEGSRLGMAHAKGSHIGMGINPKNSIGEEPKPHHHHIGEEQRVGADSGRLVFGPHGSLAFAPSLPNLKIEEKLQVDADLVKPNHEGVVIAYENHPKRKTNDETDDV